ncbi:MAG: hypothetical protein R3288_07235 [Woeseiaceae bacterium]|nr:hypothetical protein [Woeseiaceae bacterium]
MKFGLTLALITLLGLTVAADEASTIPPAERDGQVHVLPNGEFLAWDAEKEQWLDPEQFWNSFAERRRGKLWPASKEFPPYDDVKEHDTIVLLLDEGPCLMYFFHTRWRRANDVWRWGDQFNEYGGCPYVFD